MIQIRPFLDSDLEPLTRIMNQIVERGDAFVYDQQFTTEQMRTYINSYTAAFVAVLNERVVGGYVLKPNQPGRGSHVANATYMIAAEARGNGLGRLLGEHSLAAATDLGFTAIQFNAVVSSNTAAVALWERLGFQIMGTIPHAFHHADGQYVNLHVMYRSL
ncbi:MAG: GNAT family N-acetyltransferase [Planctomycetota bacterium]